MENNAVANGRQWSKAILMTAALYHLLWGLVATIIPARLLAWMVTGSDATPFSLQILGALTFSFGIAYALAAFDPFRQWVVSVSGFAFAVICSLAFFIGVSTGTAEAAFLPVVLSNWVIWIPLIGIVVYQIYRHQYASDDQLIQTFADGDYPLDLFDTTRGENLMELSEEQPVLLVFLRHFGCPFCKDTLDHIKEVREDFERCGTKIVLVYMVDQEEAKEHLDQYGLADLTQVSDPESMLYKKFRLRRGRVGELFGPKALWQAIRLYVKRGYGIGAEVGDSLQMPGVFLVRNGAIQAGFVHESAADSPDYERFLSACCN